MPSLAHYCASPRSRLRGRNSTSLSTIDNDHDNDIDSRLSWTRVAMQMHQEASVFAELTAKWEAAPWTGARRAGAGPRSGTDMNGNVPA